MRIVLVISLATNLLALGMLLAWYRAIRNKGEGTARFLTGVALNAPSLGLRRVAWWFDENGEALKLSLSAGHVLVIVAEEDIKVGADEIMNWVGDFPARDRDCPLPNCFGGVVLVHKSTPGRGESS